MEGYNEYYKQFFVLEKELLELKEICQRKTSFRVLLTGSAGCGKTTLIRTLKECLAASNISVIFMRATFLLGDLELSNYTEQQIANTIFIIDGLDEVMNPENILNKLRYMKRVIVTSRRTYTNDIFTDVIRIAPLSKNQREKIVESYLESNSMSRNKYFDLLDSSSLASNPLLLNLLMKNISDSDQMRDLLLQLGQKYSQKYTFGQGLYLQSPEIVVPEKTEIIIPRPIVEDISVVNTSLLKKVAADPDYIHKCTPRQFEELVCEMLDKKGYKVNLTNQTRDGGKDIIIVDNNLLGSFLIYVECKHYSPNRPIGVNVVRELYGTISADKATAGLLVTSSYFSKDAINFKNEVQHRINLMDYVKLISEIKELC